jgi:hypothetical protein
MHPIVAHIVKTAMNTLLELPNNMYALHATMNPANGGTTIQAAMVIVRMAGPSSVEIR